MKKAILLTKQHEIPCSDRNQQVEDSNLFIGIVTSSEINKILKSEDITDRNVRKFYLSVRQFYTSAVLYIIKCFPLNKNLVKDSQFVDFEVKEQSDLVMVCTFIKGYSKILKFTNTELDDLNKEYLDYRALPRDTIPQPVRDSAICYEVGEGNKKKTYYRMDTIWSSLCEMKIPGMDILRFHKLGKVAKVVLTILHSNAREERVFSVIHKIKRDDRGKLQLQRTLSSLVYVKINQRKSHAMSLILHHNYSS